MTTLSTTADPQQEYPLGLIVALNSGGPPMTIVGYDDRGTPLYFCSWFDDEDHEQRSHFPHECITPIMCEKCDCENPLGHAG